jgi:hypothetical protein
MAVYAAKHGGRNCVKVFSLPSAQSQSQPTAKTPAA